MKSVFLLFTASLLFVGCQSAPWKDIDRVQLGQNKASVLELLGSPSIIRRAHDRDVWLYNYEHGANSSTEREIDFANGRVVYVGAVRAPKLTAEEQDRINSNSTNKELESRTKEQAARDQYFGASRPPLHTSQPPIENEDHVDHKIRESIYGVEPDPSIERRKQAPVFEPVE
jgi:outer membrane protein assembly factor BamE (lipoprotein component of BamABCDE complex)